MRRVECISNGAIKLLYAQESDRRLIYDLSFEDKDVILSMFNDASEFHWEELRDTDDKFFDGKPGISKYLLIEYEGEIIGVFCHDYHEATIRNMEFHIWMRSTKYTGRGIGGQVIRMMLEYINQQYSIQTFIMRPWINNPRAIGAYQKCGFKVIEDFDLNAYFTKEEVAKYGNGAYSKEETVNMVLNLK